MITYIDYVVDYSGDWEGIYINFQLKYQNHSTPGFMWIEVLKEVSGTQIEIRKWQTEMDNDTYTSYPVEFMDLTLFASQYQLEGIDGADACVLHKEIQ